MLLPDIELREWQSLCFPNRELGVIVHPELAIEDGSAGIYIIRQNSTGYFYVGSSSELRRRLMVHRTALASWKHINKRFQDVFETDHFLEYNYCPCPDIESARSLENEIIKLNGDNDMMLNIIGKPMSEAQKEHLRVINTGKKASAETIAKMVKAREWYSHSDETKDKISKANKGRVYSEEQLAIIREKKSLTIYSLEGKRVLRERMTGNQYGLGYRHSPEMKEHLRSINQNKIISPETKKKISEVKKQLHEQRLAKGEAPPRSRAVMIEGVRYHSVSAAASALGVLSGTIYGRVVSKNPAYADYYFV